MFLKDDQPYTYDSLPSDHFRYLRLHPGTGQDPLQCSLHSPKIEEGKYKALSYVWGSEDRD